MAQLHELKTLTSGNGNLAVFEHIIPGVIQRVFYIYEVGQTARGGHRHLKAWNALICLRGSCRVYSTNGVEEATFTLTNPGQCLVLKPEDWHTMDRFSADAVLLVISNELYDEDDYIHKPYPQKKRADEPVMVASE